tara:strand:+ start:6370 stop:6867 length:498 start_codon:yes stop_codon:yes gene_type:complete
MDWYNKEKLIDQLIKHEGMVLQVYKDSLGIDTIGIGRNLEDRGITDGELMHMNMIREDIHEVGITEENARFLLQNDIDIVEKELWNAHKCIDTLGDVRTRVLLDMAFNMGVPRLCKFVKMWDAIHKSNFDEASVQMLDSRWAKQVKSRSITLSEAMRKGEFDYGR